MLAVVFDDLKLLNPNTNQQVCGGVPVYYLSCFNLKYRILVQISVRILVKRGASESIDADRVLVGESDHSVCAL